MDEISMDGKTDEWVMEEWMVWEKVGHLPLVASLSNRSGNDKDDDQQNGDSSRQEVALDLASLELGERKTLLCLVPQPLILGWGTWLVSTGDCGMQAAGPTLGQGLGRTCPLEGALPWAGTQAHSRTARLGARPQGEDCPCSRGGQAWCGSQLVIPLLSALESSVHTG